MLPDQLHRESSPSNRANFAWLFLGSNFAWLSFCTRGVADLGQVKPSAGRARSATPVVQNDNPAKFAQLDDEITLVQMNLVTQQNLLGWTMKVSLVGGALAWGLDPRCPGQRAGFVLWI